MAKTSFKISNSEYHAELENSSFIMLTENRSRISESEISSFADCLGLGENQDEYFINGNTVELKQAKKRI